MQRQVTPSFDTLFDQGTPPARDPDPEPPAEDPREPPPERRDPPRKTPERKDPPPPSHPDQPSRPEIEDPPAPGQPEDDIIARQRRSCCPSGVQERAPSDSEAGR